ncbi:MAG TPA: hypothetical protein G4O02_04540 [Caldilineae bacterium]|nr:hypothetical protein [Caldilineae bacterium]
MDEVRISVAGVCVALRINDAEVAERTRARYREFLAPDTTPDFVIDVAVHGREEVSPLMPRILEVTTSFHDDILTFESSFGEGKADFDAGYGMLSAAHLPMVRLLIENYLRILYAWYMVRIGGVLLHSAGVVKDKRAYLFFGPSGSGKSTITRLSMEHVVLSDDILIVRPVNGSFQVFGVPFRGELVYAPRANTRAPLVGIFRLRKAKEHRVELLSPARALAELVSCAPFVITDAAMAQRVMKICVELVRQVPVKELHFRKDSGFWRVIDAQS